MAKKQIVLVRCSLNMRQDVLDLLDAESEIRRNEPRGRSQTLNQIVLEYFEARTPQNVAVKYESGVPVVTIDYNPAKGQAL